MKKVAVIQSNYIPWKGYFDIINMVDDFILYDDVQFTKNDWRNRNKIKTQNGTMWVTIPVAHSTNQKINEIYVTSNLWRKKHWTAIEQSYSKARYFRDYKDAFKELYVANAEENLSRINFSFISLINEILGIKTTLHSSEEFNLTGARLERLLNLLEQAEATEYISGPSAKDYINEAEFEKRNIRMTWIDYQNYPPYRQLFPPFDHAVSVIDLIFNEGPEAPRYMKSFNSKPA